jgi:hypothetical protein
MGFKMDILPLFTERDIKGMSPAFDLTDHEMNRTFEGSCCRDADWTQS